MLLGTELIDEEWVPTITSLVIGITIYRVLWREIYIMPLNTQSSAQHLHRGDGVTGTAVLLLIHGTEVLLPTQLLWEVGDVLSGEVPIGVGFHVYFLTLVLLQQ